MADQINPFALLTQLETIDVQEDDILSQLLQRGAALEESERRSRMVTVAELHALRSGLTSLETAIDALQEGVARAEAAAVAPKPANGNGAPKAAEAPAPAAPAPAEPAPAVPEPPPTFDELAARIRDHDAAGAHLRATLRERFAVLDSDAASVAPSPSPGAGSVAPVTTPVPDPGGNAVVPVPARPTFRLTPKPYMHSAEIRDFQDMLNHRFERWEIGLHVPEDGVYGRTTRDAARRVARGLGIAPEDYAHGFTPAVRDLMRNPSGRTADQLGRAEDHAAWLVALRRRYPAGHVAGGVVHADRHVHPHGAHPRHASATKAAPHAHRAAVTPTGKAAPGALEAAIRTYGGRYEDVIVRECREHGVSVSLICAVIEMESGFRNVFGHDRVANPIKSPSGGLLEVTESNYHEYLRHRNRGEGAQGVGPMQLTFPAFQDSADKLGGCWKVGPNIKVGVSQLARNIKASGTRAALVIYNGNESYAEPVLKLERKWRERLAGLSGGGGGGGGGGTKPHAPTKPAPHRPGRPHAPRIYKVTPKPMSGSDIRRFQELLNHRMERWGIDLRVEEDGVYGPATKLMARRVARAMGIDPADNARGITPATRSVIRHPNRRTPAQIARARSNRPWKRALSKHHAVTGGKPGSVKGDGSYPLAKRGKFNGGPYQGTHRKGNWQSDNAVDLNTPVGTAMLSMDDGEVVKVFHHPQDNSGFAGDQITIRGDHGNSYFYTHGVASVKAGQRVRRGQVLGTTGKASGVAHLHFGVKKGDPRQLIGQYK